MSRRTFFAYFPSKADLLLIRVDELGGDSSNCSVTGSRARPWGHLRSGSARECLAELVQLFRPSDGTDDPELAKLHAKLFARWRTRWLDWEDRLAETLREVGGFPGDDLRPRTAASMILGAVRAALEVMVESEAAPDVDAATATRAFEFLQPVLARLVAGSPAVPPPVFRGLARRVRWWPGKGKAPRSGR